MNPDPELHLSKRERQIMDIIYSKGKATGQEVMESLPDSLSYSAVRTFLRILEQKGHLKHRKEAQRFVYYPAASAAKVSRSATRRLLHTFFGGAVERAVVALLEASDLKLPEAELKRIEAMIERAKKERK
jgi:predicted transcriptional regulator